MEQQQLAGDFTSWTDRLCRQSIPTTAQAFNFNIYESERCFQIELIGASHFDAEDADWACDEVFTSRPDLFEMSHMTVGEEWELVLKLVVAWASSYLANMNNEGGRLRAAVAVTVGFVDGDLVRVWPLEAAE